MYSIPINSYIPCVHKKTNILHAAPLVQAIGRHSVITRLACDIRGDIIELPEDLTIEIVKIYKDGSVESLEKQTRTHETEDGRLHVLFHSWDIIDRAKVDYYLRLFSRDTSYFYPFIVDIELSYSYLPKPVY
jgi:hypothetical protein